MPFLVDAVLIARHGRANQVISIGMLADPHHSYGDDFPGVQAAVREHAGRLAALLRDDDAGLGSRIGAEFEVISPPEFTDHLRDWGTRFLRAAQRPAARSEPR